MRQLEKMKELLESKIRDMVSNEVKLIDSILDRARKIHQFRSQKPNSSSSSDFNTSFSRAYDDFRVIRK